MLYGDSRHPIAPGELHTGQIFHQSIEDYWVAGGGQAGQVL
jgi:hypothetical protein